jgi:PAS domain S-box-containing protein
MDDSDKTKEQLLVELQTLRAEVTRLNQAEESLRQSEERWQLAIAGTQDCIWDYDLRTHHLFLSTRCFDLLGYPPEAINTLEHWLSLVHPEDIDKLKQIFQQNLSTPHNIHYACEYRVRRQDGDYVWLLARGQACWDEAGAPVRAVGSVKDISGRKQAEKKLRQSEAEYRLLFEHNPNPMCIYDPETLKFIAVNEAAIQMHGYSAAEFSTMTIADIRPAEDVPILKAALVTSLQNPHSYVGEWRHRKKDGTLIEVEIIAHSIPWCGLQARCVLMKDVTAEKVAERALKQAKQELEIRVVERTTELSLSNDRLQIELQERTRVEAVLRESERRWRTLLEDVRLIVIGLDAEGKVNYANPFFLEITGYALEEVIGHDWFTKFLPARMRPQVSIAFRDLCEQGFHIYYENAILTKQGHERVIAWNNTLLRSPDDQLIGTLSIGEDITERQEMERLKDELISSISHELRTPLTAIQGSLNLLTDGLVQPQSERGQRVISIAAEGADRLVRLVNEILDLERLKSGEVKLMKQPYNVENLISQAVELIEGIAAEAAIAIVSRPIDISLSVDADRIVQVLVNLLSNAVKFSPAHSMISITAELRDGASKLAKSAEMWEDSEGATLAVSAKQRARQVILFTIRDQGRGIPGDHLESIFERFHQVDASDSRLKGGTGLGLAICRSIVQQHGGQIWAESQLGKGSQFYFTLPLENPYEKSVSD